MIPLKFGEIYKVTESCGMMILEGKLIGTAGIGNGEKFLVFESLNIKGNCKYFGAQWKLDQYDLCNPFIYLYNTHYGETIEDLHLVNEYNKKVKFEKLS